MISTNQQQYSIKASSNIINLLGNELIGSDSLALFELVKNSYDADADTVVIHLNHLFSDDSEIVIEDDGNGMTQDVIERAWLTIGTDYKRKELKISPVYKRTSLGNKGVGRLAVHRLADNIKLETQARGVSTGSSLFINWNTLMAEASELDKLTVNVSHGIIGQFVNNHGTRITLTGLKERNWNVTKVKSLVTKLQGILNPFSPKDDFRVIIKSDNSMVQGWVDSVTSSSEIIANSLYRFDFKLCPGYGIQNEYACFDWTYSFHPINVPTSSQLIEHTLSKSDHLMIDGKEFSIFDEDFLESFYLKNKLLAPFNKIEGCFYGFSTDGKVLDLIYGAGKRVQINTYLNSNGGVRIFRDGIRVYNYGEPYDDWLEINRGKAKRMGSHFSKNQIIGGISLSLDDTKDSLVEKTNREGFIENEQFELFTLIIKSVYGFFEKCAMSDKSRLQSYFDNTSVTKKIGFSDTINELEKKLQYMNLDKVFSPLVEKVKKDYDNMRNVMLNSGMNGLNLTIVFHEVEREMGFISHDIMKPRCDLDNIRMRIKALMDLIEKFMPLMRNSKNVTFKASKYIDRVNSIHGSRFAFHKVILSNRFKDNPLLDFEITGPSGLILSALSNIVDNAIYWSRERRAKDGDSFKPAVMTTPDVEHFDGPAILVVDNGNGFQMEAEDMILPFRTLKPKGLGVGLYYTSLVMEIIGGKLLFPDIQELNLPEVYDGACVALVFPKK